LFEFFFSRRITELTNYPKYDVPIKIGSTYYFSQNSGLQNQPIIYSSKSLDSESPQVFIDVNKMSKDGTTFLSYYLFSPDNKWCAYGFHEGGGDWVKIRIKNVETGVDLEETLTKIKFIEPTWNKDSSGFFYLVRLSIIFAFEKSKNII
jgi:prolyl oligopeptidase